MTSMATSETPAGPSFGEAFMVWLKIGCINFGGPAGQIALMHRVTVDEKKWVDEARFLHALNFCMLLPGPEAQKLATYLGLAAARRARRIERRHSVRSAGRVRDAGPEPALRPGRGISVVDGALFGIKAAVLVIVIEALIRIGKRALKTPLLLSLAAAAFVGIFFLALPFPLIVAAAALIGYLVARKAPGQLGLTGKIEDVPPPAKDRWRQFTVASIVGVVAWWLPVALAALVFGPTHVLVSIGTFFSKLAVVSFGGAYALLAYMAQEAVQTYGWMTAPEMVDGLGLAETTPGPLILVTQFVGFLAAFRDAAALLARNRGRSRRSDDDLGDLCAIHALDFRGGPVCRATAREQAVVRRACRHHRGCGRCHFEPVGVVRASCAVRQSHRNAHRSVALVCL